MMRLSTLWRVDGTIGADGGSPVAEAILARWDADTGSARFFRSSANFLYRCRRAGEPHFLRFADSGERGREAIAAECALLRWLAGKGIAVAVPAQSRAGEMVETVETAWGTFHAVLFPALAGKGRAVADLDEAGFRCWGAALGRLHAATRSYDDPGTAARPTWRGLLAFIAGQIPAEATALQGELAAVEATLAALPTTPDTYGLCHFDFELDNLVWDGECPRILDFDDCAHLWRVADITLALGDFFATGAGTAAPHFRAFVAGYGEAHSLDEAALTQIPVFLRLADLFDYARIERATDLAIIPEHPTWLVQLDGRLRQWAAQYQAGIEGQRA
ncbi:MAG: hypothetical protein AVDCRST_MAG18-4965 [uncultured Thermomicrobiales bacterium]|uniref:Aminoglycoside phosphotransferase domain-containing protein n=1 Tax=uncultured Thermomicrobiales bacterium TaxID=1645740 RepID=A0A6J4VWI5_9BACT|nr:MAG: hypothetical protein AVDCRST_MAG18-4965 [uncultured Thermomicrobiales bacterium]